MNRLFLLASLVGLTSGATAYADMSASNLLLCRQDCYAQNLPAYALKACMYKCEKLIDMPAPSLNYCNTDEPDCERDTGDDDGSAWLSK
ncbi:MAG: hypothetical protein HRT45_02730 [Bdellovibrionales bacterium]|nr:hypothetical protein [Bdellovibrionales bacterium]